MRSLRILAALSLCSLAAAGCRSTPDAAGPGEDTEPAPAPTPRAAEPAAEPEPGLDPHFASVAERLAARREAARSLSRDYVVRGRNELGLLELEAALESFSIALELDPENQEAREGLRIVRELLDRASRRGRGAGVERG